MEISRKSENPFITESSLCNSLGGVKIPLLTITDPDESVAPMAKRKYIVCTGRAHPGESNGSWMIQVMGEFLLKD